jgi:hypothetical protein
MSLNDEKFTPPEEIGDFLKTLVVANNSCFKSSNAVDLSLPRYAIKLDRKYGPPRGDSANYRAPDFHIGTFNLNPTFSMSLGHSFTASSRREIRYEFYLILPYSELVSLTTFYSFDHLRLFFPSRFSAAAQAKKHLRPIKMLRSACMPSENSILNASLPGSMPYTSQLPRLKGPYFDCCSHAHYSTPDRVRISLRLLQ